MRSEFLFHVCFSCRAFPPFRLSHTAIYFPSVFFASSHTFSLMFSLVCFIVCMPSSHTHTRAFPCVFHHPSHPLHYGEVALASTVLFNHRTSFGFFACFRSHPFLIYILDPCFWCRNACDQGTLPPPHTTPRQCPQRPQLKSYPLPPNRLWVAPPQGYPPGGAPPRRHAMWASGALPNAQNGKVHCAHRHFSEQTTLLHARHTHQPPYSRVRHRMAHRMTCVDAPWHVTCSCGSSPSACAPGAPYHGSTMLP